MPSFTPLDLTLVLLRRMQDFHPALVERARRELGADAARMREANRRWQASAHGRYGRGEAARYRAALGEPGTRARVRLGDLECEALRWPLPLWPELRFEVLLGPDGRAWNAWLVRAPGHPAPVLRTAADLVPWAATVDEVAAAFPPARPLEGTAPTRTRLLVAVPEDGGPVPYLVDFTWGLLQTATRRGPDRADSNAGPDTRP
ncbi:MULTISPECIES: hypothetical protein [unclassified Streptomyces]|uniref:hypothetical protein n=2 Tax=Streptomyces TaxID=1883 RepID=UPI0023B953A8|nr:hypothetical protein [Streptomyces sp. AM 3-1-1]WEH27178.1 hypothetical protein P0D76_07475 [Streptomyces sp. AM 3-1-1]